MKAKNITAKQIFIIILLIATCLFTGAVYAQEKKLMSLTKALPGVTPESDYTGDFWDRSTALGDLFGKRQKLYEMGITIDAEVTQVVQGIAGGGPDDKPGTRYSSLADYGVTFDTGKLGLWSSGLFTVNAQSSWGNSMLGDSENISPTNFLSLYPKTDDDDTTVLMEYYFTQALPRNMLLIAGRLNAVNFLDKNRIANNPRNQFLNLSLNNDPLIGEFISFSTYAGILVAPITKNFTVALAVWDPNDQPGHLQGTNGVFDEVGIGTQLELDWTLGKHLGGAFRPVFMYNTANTIDLNNPRLVFDLITGQQLEEETDSYMAHFNLEQYFWKPDTTTTGAKRSIRDSYKFAGQSADYDFQERGVGLFMRGSWIPKDRSAFNVYLSGGIGGRGIFESRPYDRFGVGTYWLKESDDLDDLPGNLTEDEVGFEAFYNFAITPWTTLSADFQWIDSGVTSTDDQSMLGIRLNIDF